MRLTCPRLNSRLTRTIVGNGSLCEACGALFIERLSLNLSGFCVKNEKQVLRVSKEHTMQLFDLSGPDFLNPFWFNQIRHGEHEATVNETGHVIHPKKLE